MSDSDPLVDVREAFEALRKGKDRKYEPAAVVVPMKVARRWREEGVPQKKKSK